MKTHGKDDTKEQASGVREGSPGYLSLKCLHCFGSIQRAKVNRDLHADEDSAVCFDCLFYQMTGYRDVRKMIRGLPGLQFAALVFDPEVNQARYLTVSFDGERKWFDQKPFEILHG